MCKLLLYNLEKYKLVKDVKTIPAIQELAI